MPKDNTTAPEGQTTLADVIARIEKLDGVTTNRRRDLLSSVRSVVRLSGGEAADIVVDIAALRAKIMSFHPVQARISKQRLSNIKAGFRAALEATGAIPEPLAARPLSEKWRAFLSFDKFQAGFLGRLSRYCAATGKEPEDVDDALMVAFHAYLDARLLGFDPARICRQAKYKFNAIIRDNGLAIPPLTTRKDVRRNLPLTAYPEPFRADLEALLDRRANPDLYDDDEDAVLRPHSPITLRNDTARVRQALDAAVSAGMKPEEFQSLADLVRVSTIRIAFAEMRRRNDGKFRSGHFEISHTLLGIARHYVKAEPDDIDKIRKLRRKIAKQLDIRHKTMGARSKKQLDQFLHKPDNVGRLLLLPERHMASIKGAPINRRTALVAMYAAAIATLLSCPVRIKNLSGLRLGETIWSVEHKGTHRYQVHIPASEVKNRVEIEAILSRGASRILDRYIATYRKLLAPMPTSVLFPAQSGGVRNPGTLGDQLSKTVRDATGLYVTAHGFRHFAAFYFLQAHPGEYATVQKMLGHTKIDTTIRFYAPLTSASALERYNDLLDMHWGKS